MVCCPVLPAGAQTTPIDEARQTARLHIGALYLTPTLQLKDVGVDTNVFNSAEPARDYTLTLSPGVQVAVPVARRALLAGSVAANAVYFQRYATERSVSPAGSFR